MSPFPLQAAKDGLHDEHGRLGADSLDDYGNICHRNVLSGFRRALWASGCAFGDTGSVVNGFSAALTSLP